MNVKAYFNIVGFFTCKSRLNRQNFKMQMVNLEYVHESRMPKNEHENGEHGLYM